jgi:hypothetical protein
MNNRLLLRSVLISFALIRSLVLAQDSKLPLSSETVASPEMDRLAKAFVGDWDNTETMERSQYFPSGGRRHGTSHWRLAVGGTTIVGEGHSDGSVGPLDHLILIWWDKKAKNYDYFVCFKDTGSSCRVRGNAHWDGDNFVNDYEEVEHGNKTKWRDSFVQITANSYTLLAAREEADGRMKTLITTKSTRR